MAEITRREFLELGAIAAVGAVASSCAKKETPQERAREFTRNTCIKM